MTRRRRAFTLIELLTVAFILAVMIALLLPAIQRYRALAMQKKNEVILNAIRSGISSYKNDFHMLPPSEPDKVNQATDGSNKYCGSMALLFYLNGLDGKGYALNYGSYNSSTRVWDPRVTGAQMLASVGFQDAWGWPIEYFVAYTDRAAWQGKNADGTPGSAWPRPNPGQITADVYPRAVNADLGGAAGDYSAMAGGVKIGGKGLRLPVTRWLDVNYNPDNSATPLYSDYRLGWETHSVPEGIGSYRLISAGPDGMWGTADDSGDAVQW